MLKKSKVKSVTGIFEEGRKKSSSKPDNLYVSPSFLNKFAKFSIRKKKSHFSKNTSKDTEKESLGKLFKEPASASTFPTDAAVHFGNFYDVHKSKTGRLEPGKTKNFQTTETTYCKATPRTEFTRQMVHKLERTAGTEEYARQVSALLEETVEPPHFKLNSLPAEDSIPEGKQNPTGYPLWYKEPYKMSSMADEIYKILKEKYGNNFKESKDVFEDECSDEDIPKESSDIELEEEEEEDTSVNFGADDSMKKVESLSVTFSSSASTTEAKDTDSKESDDNISGGIKQCKTVKVTNLT